MFDRSSMSITARMESPINMKQEKVYREDARLSYYMNKEKGRG